VAGTGDGVSPVAAAAAGIKALLANALAPNKAEAFKAVLLFTVSTSHLRVYVFPCRNLVQRDRQASRLLQRLLFW
jgi:hypothetical protein